MFDALRQFGDRLLGRGSAAVAVPVMDGPLKPDRSLDHAEIVATLPGIDDLASDGQHLYVSAGAVLYRLQGSTPIEVRRFDAEITAVAADASGAVAVAIGGREIRCLLTRGDAMERPDGASLRRPDAGAWVERARIDRIGGAALHAVNALAFESRDRIVFSDGSMQRAPDDWCRDLMEKGRTGRVGRWVIGAGAATPVEQNRVELLADGLHYAFGVLPVDGSVLFSESWRHRLGRTAPAATPSLLADLPGYPSRLSAASKGGCWVTCFVCRTQLVEFVLREDAYRARMLETIDPRYWIAPALRSGASYLEPLQGAGVKQMGVLKPWAPPRSYGLVLHVDALGRITRSLHSQVDGMHHGITAAVEFGGALFAASKGSGRLLRVALNETAPGARP